ncbi:sulfur carrier protein ThiS [Staphylococcus simulans]|uniref:sulfur carrier protein ThiS n=1 Tax=Staphylococcus simulans TaxID=1286 RepID=UPI00399A8383
MKCIINGDPFTFDSEVTIQDILDHLELDKKRVIAEHNQNLIQREDFANQMVREDDRLELLEFVGGG